MKTNKRQLKPKRLIWIWMLVISMVTPLLPVQQATVQAAGVMKWHTVGSAGFSAGLTEYTSIAIDRSGTPYVVYRDYSGKATVMKYNGSSWETVGSAGFSAGRADYTSIAIDSSGTPYVVYKDYGNLRKATVMKYNESGWEIVGNAGFSAGEVDYPSIAIDSNDTPYVVYRDYGNSEATVMKYNESSWETVGSAGFSAGRADYTSIAIDSNGTPYVVYKDGGNGARATVMKYNGSSWETVGSAGFSADEAFFTSIAIDSRGTPYVVYRDGGNSNKATVMKYNESSWETVGSAGFSAGQILNTSIAIDSSRTPYVVYTDGGNGARATVMKYNGSSWETVGSEGFSTGSVDYPSIAIDSRGTPYVIYKDGGNSNKATVMKFSAVPMYTVSAAAATATPGVGIDDAVTLTVKDSMENTDTTFSGARNVTISGYTAATDGSYGSFNGTDLTAGPNTISVTFTNGVATANLRLNKAAAQTIGFSVAGVATPAANTVSITPAAGSAASMALTTAVTAPAGNGGAFAQQPVVTLRDAYGNTSTGDSSTVVTVSKKDTGAWTLTGTIAATANAGIVTFAGLGATNAAEVTGAQLAFDATGLTQVTSTTVTLPAPAAAQTVSAAAATATPGVGVDDTVTLTVKDTLGNTDTTFSGARNVTISGYTAAPDGSYGSFNGTVLTAGPNTISVTFTNGVATANLRLNKAAAQTIGFSVAGVAMPAANTVNITPAAGSAASMALTTAVTAPASNGGAFAQQPVVTLRDAYGNTSTGDSSTVVTVSKKDTGAWVLTGPATATANAGIVTFAGLGATNAAEVTGAQLAFDATGLTQATSQSVTLPWPGTTAPSVESVTAGDSHVLLTWSKVYGSVSYAVYQGTASGTYGDAVATVTGLTYDATGLTNGTTYYFVVKAVNPSGISAASNEVSATPQVAAPGVPVLGLAAPGDARISLNWDPVIGSTGYKIFRSTTSGVYGLEEASVSGSVYGYDVTGLTNGTTYYFVIQATNPGGDSTASNEVSATPRTVPSAPTGVTAVAGNGQATVSFTTPANGGSDITYYKVTAMPGNITVTGASSPITVTGLSNGVAYTFTVQAVNSAGSSAASDASTSVTPREPSSSSNSSSTPATPQPAVDVFNSSIVNEVNLVKTMEAKVTEAKQANVTIDFADIKGHWAEKTIAIFYKLQVIKGYEDGTLRPDNKITRAEFAVILNRVFNIQGSNNTSIVLKDIGDNWAKEAIENLVAAGVIKGYDDGKFRPDNTITREEMVIMLSRIVDLNNVAKDTTKGNFNDVNGTYAADEIKAEAQAGIVSGKGDGRFDPKSNATRAEALQIILNALKLDPQLKSLLHSLN